MTITYKQSQEILKKLNIIKKQTESLNLSDINNRILAKDIIARESLPLSPTSSMDGYALKFEDLDKGVLSVISQTPAGDMPSISVETGTCIKTFTGSFMPLGADTLIPIENVTFKYNKITITKKVSFGFAVRNIGEVYEKGDILLKKGTVLSFASIGIIASLGLANVEVLKKPIVTILSTGSEILEPGNTKTNASQIYSSNNYTLEALFQSAGAKVNRIPIIRDDESLIKQAIKKAIDSGDIIVTTGGVSVGDYDFVKNIIQEFGFTQLLSHVDIKPGQHIKILEKNSKFIFALPGFPYSSTITAILYVVPMVKKLLGLDEQLFNIQVIMENEVYNRTNKTMFKAVDLEFRDGKIFANNKEKKIGSSALLTNMLGNSAIIKIEKSKLEIGEVVEAILL